MTFSINRADWNSRSGDISRLRQRVFIEEQGVSPALEMDGQDQDCATIHFLGILDERPIATGRVLSTGKIGRICVLKEYRGLGYGKEFLRAIIKDLLESDQHRCLYLHSQVHACDFYSQFGFDASGATFKEANIDHQRMELELDTPSLPGLLYRDDVIRCSQADVFNRHMKRMVRAGVRHLDILSLELSQDIYDDALAQLVSAFVRHHRAARTRILLQNTKRLAQQSHPLVTLAQRLPSSVEIKVLKERPQKPEQGFACIDQCALVFFNDEDNVEGFANYRARAEAEHLLEEFERLWQQHSARDPNLSRLTL